MKYSIVIPAYNEEKYVKNSIRALKEQNVVDRSEFEIIVVDNNSTDNTYEEAKKEGADVVIKEPEKGTNIARQAGFKISKGEIVAFLDADSSPIPNWLEKIDEDLNKKGVAAVSGPYEYGVKGLPYFLLRFYDKYLLGFGLDVLRVVFGRKNGMIFGGNFAAKRIALEKIGGLPPLKYWGDDAAVAMLISRKVGKVLFDPDLLVRSSTRRFEKYGFSKMIFNYIVEYLKVFFNKDFE